VVVFVRGENDGSDPLRAQVASLREHGGQVF
jgi:hypothetical protein